MTVEHDVDSNIMTSKLPRIKIEPVIRHLNLITIHNLLLENTIAVPQPVTPSRVVQTGQRVQKARRKASETAVSERRIMLMVDDILNPETELAQPFPCKILDVVVENGVIERSAHQKLEGEVVDTLLILEGLLLLSLVPVDDQAITNGECGTAVCGLIVAVVEGTSESGFDMANDIFLYGVSA